MKGTLILAGMALMAGSAFANLIVDGGFEVNSAFPGNFSGDTADAWFNLSGATTPDVWDNTGADGLAPGFAGYMPHITAYEGTNWASLVGTIGWQEYIGSTYIALNPGVYTLSMAVIYDAHNPGGYTSPAGLDIFLAEGTGPYNFIGSLAQNTGSDQWELRSMSIVINSADMYSIGIQAQVGSAGSAYLGVDDVQLNPVPEPATMAALGLGAAAMIRRRRK